MPDTVPQVTRPVAPPVPAPASPGPKIEALTGLRYVAALLVYLSHLPPGEPYLPAALATFMQSGFNGVALFFVLSGFVICYNYYDRFTADFRAGWWPYFVARFARIYPVYWLMFLAALGTENLGAQWASPRTRQAILEHATLTQAWDPNILIVYSFNSQGWSVSVEIFLYLMFPLAVFPLLRRAGHHPAGPLALAAGLWGGALALALWFALQGETALLTSSASHYWLYRLPLLRLSDFVAGCAAARLFMLLQTRPVSPREARLGALALYGALAATAFLMVFNRPLLTPFRYDSAYTLFFAVIIFCLARYHSRPARWLSTPALVLLGEASYSLYMVHVFVLKLVQPRLKMPGEPDTYLYGLLIFILINLLALGLYTYFETPARRFIRRLTGARP